MRFRWCLILCSTCVRLNFRSPWLQPYYQQQRQNHQHCDDSENDPNRFQDHFTTPT